MKNTTTDYILVEIEENKKTQPAIAKTLASVIMCGKINNVDWKKINAAIVERWSPSARERVLTMAWKIVEKNNAEMRENDN